MQLLLVAHHHSHLAVYDEFGCKFTYFYVHLLYGLKQFSFCSILSNTLFFLQLLIFWLGITTFCHRYIINPLLI